MSAKAIREATGKDIINRLLEKNTFTAKCTFASVDENTNWEQLATENPWLKTSVSNCLLDLLKL